MRATFRVLALALLVTGGAGCTSDSSSAGSGGDASRSASAIPWNRPEKWEGTGALGGMVNSTGGVR